MFSLSLSHGSFDGVRLRSVSSHVRSGLRVLMFEFFIRWREELCGGGIRAVYFLGRLGKMVLKWNREVSIFGGVRCL